MKAMIVLMLVSVNLLACYSDFECGHGNRCAKINGPYNDGVCVVPQKAGMGFYPDTTTTCFNNLQCGFGKRCIKGNAMSNEGICSH